MMWKDPIIEEVRKARDAYAAKFDYDIGAMCRDLEAHVEQDQHMHSLAPHPYPPEQRPN